MESTSLGSVDGGENPHAWTEAQGRALGFPVDSSVNGSPLISGESSGVAGPGISGGPRK